MINVANIAIGACSIQVDGSDVGLTTEAGVTFSEPVRQYEEIWDDHSILIATKILTRVSRTISFELQEVTTTWLAEFFNLSSLNPITYHTGENVIKVVIIGPASGGKSFTYTTYCWSIRCGDIVRSKSREVVLPVTLEEKGNILDHNSSFGKYLES